MDQTGKRAVWFKQVNKNCLDQIGSSALYGIYKKNTLIFVNKMPSLSYADYIKGDKSLNLIQDFSPFPPLM